MSRKSAKLDPTVVGGVGATLAGGGVVTFALFPLAIPILILTLVFLAPVLLLGAVPALLVAIVVLVVAAIRAIARRVRGRSAEGPQAVPARRAPLESSPSLVSGRAR